MTQRKSNTTLTVPSVKLEIWQQLYAAAFEFRSMEMWKTFSESEHFGFVHPDTGEYYIGSILGELGEVFALILYHGDEGLRFCRSAMELSCEEGRNYLAFNMRCLMCDFVNKTNLHKEDKQVLESLQVAVPRKRHMYPQFRAHRPAFVPWFVDSGEAEALRMGLVVAAKFCAEYGSEEGIGSYQHLPISHLPIYRLTGDDSGKPASWTAEIEPLPVPSEAEAPDVLTAIPLDQVRQAYLKSARLGQRDAVLQIDAFYLPSSVNEGFDRPRYVRVLLGVDAASGMVLYTNILSGDEDLGKEIWEGIFKIVQTAGGLPGVIQVRSAEIMGIVTPAMEELLVEVVRTENLDTLDEVKASLTSHMSRS